MTDPVIHVAGIRKTYGALVAVDEVSLDVHEAEIFGLIGPNGADKTTTMVGFVIASIVPTARFAQPIGALVLYPMLALSGIFMPVPALPPVLRYIARALPLTYVVSLLQGIWRGDSWMAHLGDLGALAVVFVVCVALSSRIFRWE